MCYYNNSIRFLILLFLVRGKLYGYYPKRQRTCEYQEKAGYSLSEVESGLSGKENIGIIQRS